MGRKKLPMVAEADLVFSFRQAVKVFQALAPKRMETLRILQKTGPQSIYALAKRIKRHYSNVYSDVKALRKIGLVEKDPEGLVMVPWEAVEIRFPIEESRKEKKG